MRTTPALRTLAAALLAGGTLAATTTTATAAATPSRGDDRPIRGTVVSRTELNVRQEPTTHSPVVAALAPGARDLVQCRVKGQSVDGNPVWYWLYGAQGWANAAFVDVGRARVPDCADPCPRWKDGDWTNWDDPFHGVSVTVSGSWSFTVTVTSGASSGGWEWIPAGR